MMKTATLMVGIVATVLSLIIADAVAQAPPGTPGAVAIIAESPLKGVVVNATATSLTVNGPVKVASRRKHIPKSEEKLQPERQNIDFFIKSAALTRDGKPCKPKDIQRGDSVTIEFTSPNKGSSKFVATKVDVRTAHPANVIN